MPPLTLPPITDLRIVWQCGQLRETKRGKIKSVVTGIPDKAFFHAYKNRTEFRHQVQSLGITLHRLAKNNWETICWINRHNRPLFSALPEIVIPEPPVTDNAPF